MTGAQAAAIMSELPSAVPAWLRATDPVAEPGRRGRQLLIQELTCSCFRKSVLQMSAATSPWPGVLCPAEGPVPSPVVRWVTEHIAEWLCLKPGRTGPIWGLVPASSRMS